MDELFAPDAFLSEILNRPVFQFSALPSRVFIEKHSIKEFLETRKPYAYCKVPVTAPDTYHVLEDLGFRLADTNVSFSKNLNQTPPSFADGRTKLRKAEPRDRDGVAKLAEDSFTFSRFHLDPEIPKEKANTIKRKWAENYFLGIRGNAMFVAERAGKVHGFSLLLHLDDLVIDLIAVDSNLRGQGIAQALIHYAEQESPGFKHYRVGTQAANVSSIRLYERLGFRFVGASYVFHYHPPKVAL